MSSAWPHHDPLAASSDTLSRRDLRRSTGCAISCARRSTRAADDEQLSESLTATLAAKAEGRRLVGIRVRLAVVESAVSGRRNARRRCCAAFIAASACGRSPRAARPIARASCWGSSAAARAAASRCACRRRSRSTSCICCGGARWSVGSYQPRWVKVDAGGREIVALTFVVRRDHPQYAGRCRSTKEADVFAQRVRRVRLVARLSRAHARRAGRARHRRSVPRSAGDAGRDLPGRRAVVTVPPACRAGRRSALDRPTCRPPSTLIVSPVM